MCGLPVQLLHSRLVGDVHRDSERLAASLADRGRRGFRLSGEDIRHDDPGTRGGEQVRNGTADTAAGARNDGRLSLEPIQFLDHLLHYSRPVRI